jgi:short subunit dehydrogenase-like uncharacterized protein
MAETELAPIHLGVTSVGTYLTTSSRRRYLLRAGLRLLQRVVALPHARPVLERALPATIGDPRSERARRARWTVLAEARSEGARRNVVIMGRDVYGLSAELLAAGALELARKDKGAGGVVAPVEAVGLAALEDELRAQGVTIDVYEPR